MAAVSSATPSPFAPHHSGYAVVVFWETATVPPRLKSKICEIGATNELLSASVVPLAGFRTAPAAKRRFDVMVVLLLTRYVPGGTSRSVAGQFARNVALFVAPSPTAP